MDAATQVDMLAKRLDNDDLTSVIKYMSFHSRKIYNKVLGIYRDWIKYLGSL